MIVKKNRLDVSASLDLKTKQPLIWKGEPSYGRFKPRPISALVWGNFEQWFIVGSFSQFAKRSGERSRFQLWCAVGICIAWWISSGRHTPISTNSSLEVRVVRRESSELDSICSPFPISINNHNVIIPILHVTRNILNVRPQNKARSGCEIVVAIKTHPNAMQHLEFLNVQLRPISLIQHFEASDKSEGCWREIANGYVVT